MIQIGIYIDIFTWHHIFLYFNSHPSSCLWVYIMNPTCYLFWKFSWYCAWSVCKARGGQKNCHKKFKISSLSPLFTHQYCPWFHVCFLKHERLDCEIKVSLGYYYVFYQYHKNKLYYKLRHPNFFHTSVSCGSSVGESEFFSGYDYGLPNADGRTSM